MRRAALMPRAVLLLCGIALALGLAARPAFAQSLGARLADNASCAEGISAAERRYATPVGLLAAIAAVETGRRDASSGELRPWPWTVNAENQGHYFASRAAAMDWVRQAQARGLASIDVGCMQVNLMYHPTAFRTLDEAFDPVRNADYAARFLLQLCAASGSWLRAVGFYHSQTPALATGYRRQVHLAFARSVVAVRSSILQQLQSAWGATLPSAGRSSQFSFNAGSRSPSKGIAASPVLGTSFAAWRGPTVREQVLPASGCAQPDAPIFAKDIPNG